MLSRKCPGTRIVADFDDEDWRDWRHIKTAALGMLAGPPCGSYVPSGKGKFLSDPRAQYLFGIGTVACAQQPKTVDVETLYAIAGADGARARAHHDRRGDERCQLPQDRCLEHDRRGARSRSHAAATHGPTVFRNISSCTTSARTSTRQMHISGSEDHQKIAIHIRCDRISEKPHWSLSVHISCLPEK